MALAPSLEVMYLDIERLRSKEIEMILYGRQACL